MPRCLSYLLACCLLWASLSGVSAAPAAEHGDGHACAGAAVDADGNLPAAALECHVPHDPTDGECADCHHCQHMLPLADGAERHAAARAAAPGASASVFRDFASGPDGPPPQRIIV